MGKILGIIGGGQLGMMLTEAAKNMPLDISKIIVLDPTENCPAAKVGAEQIIADFKDESSIRELAERSDIITYEIESGNSSVLKSLESTCEISPSPETLSIIQDKFTQKKFLNDNFNNLALCGVNKNIVKYYLKKNNFSKVNVVGVNDKYDYIIMTNRAIFDGNIESLDLSKAKTCFDKYIGSTKSSVKRYGLTLSQIKENHIK